ncbi:MAG: ABC transporter ATP-binding protein [Patescibacteria group bacterium]
MSLLNVSKLTKDYGNGKGAFDINISLEPGEMLGFIGPNGAGKSTTINMCCGFIKPDSGSINLFGQEVNWLNMHRFYPKIGLLVSEPVFDPSYSASQIFKETQTLLRMDLTKRWMELADLLELDLRKPFLKLSLGNRKKVGFINCLMHDPDLVILDEPTSGLDPLIQQKCLALLKGVTARGGAVLLSSHVLSEVQSYCNRILMLKDGKVIIENTTENILNQTQKLFRLKQPAKILPKIAPELINKKVEEGNELLIYTTEHESILKILVDNDFYDFFLERPSLEETFMQYYE